MIFTVREHVTRRRGRRGSRGCPIISSSLPSSLFVTLSLSPAARMAVADNDDEFLNAPEREEIGFSLDLGRSWVWATTLGDTRAPFFLETLSFSPSQDN